MEGLKLIRACERYAEQLAEYRQEFIEAGSSMDGCGPLRRITDPLEYLAYCRLYEDPATVPEGKVQATQFFLVRGSDDRLIGMLQVRHTLEGNDYVRDYAGHIGYSVRPSARRRGYARRMLALGLEFCRELGLSRVLISCFEDNEGSQRTIIANGGVYESTVLEPATQCALKRFWIAL